MMSTYAQPKRLNTVTFVLLLLAASAGYWMWRFFPSYWDSWTVEQILRESAAKVYKLNLLNEPERTTRLRELVDSTRQKVAAEGVTDENLLINLDILQNDVTVTADYRVIVTHPGLRKTSSVHFIKIGHADVKRVSWRE